MSGSSCGEFTLGSVAKALDEIAAIESGQVSASVPDGCSDACGRDGDSGLAASPSSTHVCAKRKRAKFKVHFADEEGKNLTATKECPPSDVPPELDVKAILKDAYVPSDVFGGMGSFFSSRSNSMEKPIGRWAYTEATQPIDDYAAFARLIEEQLILAENIYINNEELICTIKVKCVKKVSRVFTRITFNNWISYDDVDCQLIPIAGFATSSMAPVLYSRYVFERQLPPVPCSCDASILTSSIILAFCVVFEDNEQRWDNHFGKNYTIDIVPITETEEPLQLDLETGAFRPTLPQVNIAPLSQPQTEADRRYRSQLRAMAPDYTFYNERSEFYW